MRLRRPNQNNIILLSRVTPKIQSVVCLVLLKMTAFKHSCPSPDATVVQKHMDTIFLSVTYQAFTLISSVNYRLAVALSLTASLDEIISQLQSCQ